MTLRNTPFNITLVAKSVWGEEGEFFFCLYIFVLLIMN